MYPHLHLFSLPVTLQPPLLPIILAPGNVRVLGGYELYHLFIYRPTILFPILVLTLTLILPLMNKKVLFKEISLLHWFFSPYFSFKICHTTNHLDHFHHQTCHSCQLSLCFSHFHRRRSVNRFQKKRESRKIKITLYREGKKKTQQSNW